MVMLSAVNNRSSQHARDMQWSLRIIGSVLLAASGWVSVASAQSATVYVQAPVPPEQARVINSNAVTNPEGSDQDVAAYDNFKLNKAATVAAITWRGKDAGQTGLGFTIKIYPSKSDPAAGPDSKYPPAKPGALVCEPLKAAIRGR